MGIGKGCFRTWSVADSCIKWRADNGNVVVLIGLDKTLDRLQVGEAGNAGEGPLDSYILGIVRASFLGYCSIIVSSYLLIPLLE